MITRTLTPAELPLAAAALRAGQPVVMPTETVYGLAASAWSAEAIDAVFRVKERPAEDPLIVHVSPGLLGGDPWAGLVRLGLVDPGGDGPMVRRLAEGFWPGPLTLLLPRGPAVLDAITAGLPSVALRMPAHPVALGLIDAASLPLVAPSANRFGRISPTTAQAARVELEGRVGLVLDGGPCAVGLESTILRLLPGQPPTVLRPGAISAAELGEVLGVLPEIHAAAQPDPQRGPQPAPGLLDRHYAPRTPLWAVPPVSAWPAELTAALARAAPGSVGLLAWTGDAGALAELAGQRWQVSWLVRVLAPGGQPDEAARDLYARLRELDEAGLDLLLVEPMVGDDALSVALRDRLRRASIPYPGRS